MSARLDGEAVYRVTRPAGYENSCACFDFNCVQWSADGARVYYIDTPSRRVDVFVVDPIPDRCVIKLAAAHPR